MGSSTIVVNSYSHATSLLLNDYSLDFDGVDDHVVVTHDASIDFAHTDAFSGSVWVKLGQVNDNQVFFGKRFGNATYGYAFYVRSDNKVELILQGTNGTRIRVASQSTLSISTWYHLAFTYDGSVTASGVKIYINGSDDTDLTPAQDNLNTTTANTANLNLGF